MRRLAIIVALLLPASLRAQAPAVHTSADGVMYVFGYFADIFGGRLIAAFDSIPASRYDYRPMPPQMTIGQIAQHLETANFGLCERVSSLRHPRTAKDSLADTIKARWPKDTLVARLKASLDFCERALESLGPLDSPERTSYLLAFETDLAEHYSQLSVYMRLLGMVPPSALPTTPRQAIDLPTSAFAPYVGAYEFAPGSEFVTRVSNGALMVRSTNGGAEVRLWPTTNSDFFVKEVDAQVTFIRDASGAVTGLVRHQFGRDRFARKIR